MLNTSKTRKTCALKGRCGLLYRRDWNCRVIGRTDYKPWVQHVTQSVFHQTVPPSVTACLRQSRPQQNRNNRTTDVDCIRNRPNLKTKFRSNPTIRLPSFVNTGCAPSRQNWTDLGSNMSAKETVHFHPASTARQIGMSVK